ncbi:hypothetical protein C8Q76DRAFT_795427 [Earliella scabrosa]|nr:hypothetical protein C8Q76DRAFT_795427 [Earliella scabrosa]
MAQLQHASVSLAVLLAIMTSIMTYYALSTIIHTYRSHHVSHPFGESKSHSSKSSKSQTPSDSYGPRRIAKSEHDAVALLSSSTAPVVERRSDRPNIEPQSGPPYANLGTSEQGPIPSEHTTAAEATRQSQSEATTSACCSPSHQHETHLRIDATTESALASDIHQPQLELTAAPDNVTPSAQVATAEAVIEQAESQELLESRVETASVEAESDNVTSASIDRIIATLPDGREEDGAQDSHTVGVDSPLQHCRSTNRSEAPSPTVPLDDASVSLFTLRRPADEVNEPVDLVTARYDGEVIIAHIMDSALLVEGGRSHDDDVGDQDDWTSVECDDSAQTPCVTTPPSDVAPSTRGSGEDATHQSRRLGPDALAESVVLLTQSECLAPSSAYPAPRSATNPDSAIPAPSTPARTETKHVPTALDLTKDFASAEARPSPGTPATPGGTRPRVHTPDRPDWAVAPRDELVPKASVAKKYPNELEEGSERKVRRHSLEHPDWAVAALGELEPKGSTMPEQRVRQEEKGKGKRRRGRHSR